MPEYGTARRGAQRSRKEMDHGEAVSRRCCWRPRRCFAACDAGRPLMAEGRTMLEVLGQFAMAHPLIAVASSGLIWLFVIRAALSRSILPCAPQNAPIAIPLLLIVTVLVCGCTAWFE